MKLRTILFALSLLVVLSASVGGYLYYSKIRESIFNEAERQSLLNAEHIKNQISTILFENLKAVKALAGLPEFKAAHKAPDQITLMEVNRILDNFSRALKVELCCMINSKGIIIASSDYSQVSTLIGRNYASKTYFKKAIRGESALQMILGAKTQQREIYYAHPVMIGKHAVGAIVIKTSVNSIENYFQEPNPYIWALRDKSGVVLASNKKSWLFHSFKPLTSKMPDERDPEIITAESPGDWIRLDELNANQAVDAAGRQYFMHKLEVDQVLGWEIIHLTPRDDILNKASDPLLRNTGVIVLALCLLIVLSVVLLYREAHTDLLKRKIAEEEIKRLKEFNENIVQSMTEGIAIEDRQGNFIFINPAAADLLGYRSQELLRKHWTAVVQPDQQKIIESADRRRVMGESDRYEVQLTRKDGNKIQVLISGKPIFESGSFSGTLAVFTDISDRKRAEAQLQQMQKLEAVGTLAGGIAHNFNNLLMGIQGNASLVLLDMEKEHPHFKMLKNIENLVQTGAKLTGQLLGYAREGRYEVKPLQVNRIVKETSETFGMTKKEIKVYLELDKNLRSTLADQGQIEQVLLNLFVNAADAMALGGDLFLETKNVTDKEMAGRGYKIKTGEYVMILVRDTGGGMDENILERIFDPFFTTKGLGRGTGMGLASVYGIVKSHNGYIDVQSHKGKGTTFRIYLPAVDDKIVEKKKFAFQIVQGNETVLLVDDEEQILDVGKMMLSKLGYHILKAQSGHEAIQILKSNRHKIDLVILDMIMPDMSGSETFDRLKEIIPEQKVLLASGYSIDGKATDILKRGCDGFIQKPFDLKTLSNKVREILDKK
jgi:PAS domain S-box-containing protein